MSDITPLEEAIVELNQIKSNLSDTKALPCTCLTFRPIMNNLLSQTEPLLYSDILTAFNRQAKEMICNCEGISTDCDDIGCPKCVQLKALTIELASKQADVNTLIQSQIGTTINFLDPMDQAFN